MSKIFNEITTVVAVTLMLAAVSACGEKEFYNDEQYRKECYIVSGENNIFGQEYTYGENATGYLSIYLSGSTPTDEPVTVTLRQADHYLKDYNQSVNGTSYENYIELLPTNCYQVESWNAVVTADNSYTLFPIMVNIDNLNPDKKYFLPLEIASVSNYQYSGTKSYVLFQIYMKNAYATTKTDTYYQMTGNTLDLLAEGDVWEESSPGSSPTAFNATKKMTPLSENSVRILPGTQQSTETAFVTQRSIRLTITDEIYQNPVIGDDGLPTGKTYPVNIVKVEPLNEGNGCVQVRQAYDGTDQESGDLLYSYFNPEDKKFTLNYCYRMPSDKSGTKDTWHKVKEIMERLDY